MSFNLVNTLQSVNRIRETILKKQLIKRNEHMVISISGGQDSIYLLLIVYLLQRQICFHFGLVWYNHLWQTSSFFTMLHIAKTSFSFSSPICFFIPLNEVLSELSSRNWRFDAAQRTCLFYHYRLYIQGHSKSDRTETVLFNLIRGSGMKGISALQWERKHSFSSLNKFYPYFSTFLQETHTTSIPLSVFLQLPLPTINILELSQYGQEYRPEQSFGYLNSVQVKDQVVLMQNSSQSSYLNAIQASTLNLNYMKATTRRLRKDFGESNTLIPEQSSGYLDYVQVPLNARIKANTCFHKACWFYQLKRTGA